MTIARYAFLPWLRRGLANQLVTDATAASRARLTVEVTIGSDVATRPLTPREVQLVGPGDITGLHPQAVVRTEPRHWVTDFEPNYLSFIEFYDEDFPWRYTPRAPDLATHRLLPWITLVLLTEAEFSRRTQPGPTVGAIELRPEAVLAAIFPPVDQPWAWAHVHVNGALGTGHTPDGPALDALLRDNPDRAYARLVCPRRLQPNTGYFAFVIPTFEVGRKAGLGEPVADTDSGLAVAWDAALGDPKAKAYPVYHEWFFRTGVAGDFESLVRALQPRPIDPRVGVREMDIQAPGFGMAAVVNPPNDTVGLEGAIRSPDTVAQPLRPGNSFAAQIERIVNLPADVEDQGVPGGQDPVVSAPLYGRWHALVKRMDGTPPPGGWVDELNVDPRWRAAAGMGTLVVQTNQESYMRAAWQQIGEVLALNRKIHFVQVAIKASQALYTKGIAALAPERAFPVLSPVLGKIRGSPTTIRALVQASTLPRAALSGTVRKALRPRGATARRFFGRADGLRATHGEVVKRLNAGSITAAGPRPRPAGPTLEEALAAFSPPQEPLGWLASLGKLAWLLVVALVLLAVLLPLAPALVLLALAGVAAWAIVRSQRAARVATQLEHLTPASLTPALVDTLPQNDAFTLNDPLAPAGASASARSASIDSAEFRGAMREFHELLQIEPPAAPPRTSLDLAGLHATALAAIEPVRAFPRRAATMLRVGDRSVIAYIKDRYADQPPDAADDRVVPVMAYPDIKQPMYEPLRDLGSELLVPNLKLIPPNTITLMVTNQRFIEAYMVGLNHEFARELLWREYPTDQRPSSFRQFWDTSSVIDTQGLSPQALAEKLRDITRLHEWLAPSMLGAHNNRPAPAGGDNVILTIRGDLLKRYPNTIIYAQRARWGDRPGTEERLVLWDETGEKSETDPADPNLRYPLFRARVDPDLHFIGFDLTIPEVRGAPGLKEDAASKATIPADQLGWFFVLKEVVGEPRFGLDETASPVVSDHRWDNLAWEHLGGDIKLVDVARPFASQPGGTQTDGVAWGSNAADMAFILYQKPVLVAVHGRDMLRSLG